ncbi:MAG: PAS domain S-box protein [Campylobacterales bacterium]|nr:PAS domain S-box protein [Campylobacterales bacterium]
MQYIRVFGALIIFILTLVVYIIWRQKYVLNDIVALYDKNVIFSITDTHGVITHVSDAFCKISGYTREELVGNPHSLIRHPDMPREFFKELWMTIENKQAWHGEIKNSRQDGSFYWVDADINPIIEKGEIVGYSSIRQDITDSKELDSIQKEIIFTMGEIAENRSAETGNHVKRVALYSKVFAKHYGLSEDEIDTLYQASPMHDIGKIAIPDAILNKPSHLTEVEMEIMKTHAQKGYDILKVSARPLFQAAAIIAYHHHEHWDGGGYPRGLIQKEIDIFGRITAIADVFDALGTKRCYKEAWSDDAVFAYLKEQSGRQFEPKLVDIFFEHLDEFLAIRDSLE